MSKVYVGEDVQGSLGTSLIIFMLSTSQLAIQFGKISSVILRLERVFLAINQCGDS